MVLLYTYVNNFNKYLHSDVNLNELALLNFPTGNNNELNIYQSLMEYLIYLVLFVVLALFLNLNLILSNQFSFTSGNKLLVLCILTQVLPVFNLNKNTVTDTDVPDYLSNSKTLHFSQLYIDNFKSLQFSPLFIHNFKTLHFSVFSKNNFKSSHYSPFYIYNIDNEYFRNHDQNAYIIYEKQFSNSILNRSNMLFVAKMR